MNRFFNSTSAVVLALVAAGCATPVPQALNSSQPVETAAGLRERADRARYHAVRLSPDPASARLFALADELDARANALTDGN